MYKSNDNNLFFDVIVIIVIVCQVAIYFYIHGSNIDKSTLFLKKVVTDTIGLLKRKSNEGTLTVENQELVARKVVDVFDHLLTKHQLPNSVYGDIFQFHIFLVSAYFNLLRSDLNVIYLGLTVLVIE